MKHQYYWQSFYPISYRKEDTREIINRLTSFQPLSLIGLPRVGLTRMVRFLLGYPQLFQTKLKTKKIILIEININEIFQLKEVSFWQLVLKRIIDESKKIKDCQIENLYFSATRANDAFTYFDNAKLALEEICDEGYLVFLFFNRFDRIASLFSFWFFAHLQSLFETAPSKINLLFTLNRPLEQFCPEVFKGASLELFSQKYFLKPSSLIDLRPIIKEFNVEKKTNKNLIFQFSGGHAQYAKLIVQALKTIPGNDEKVEKVLSKDPAISEQSKELWDFLTFKEKELIFSDQKISSEHFLSRTGFLNEKGEIFSPLLAHFAQEQWPIEKSSGQELTKKEKALLSLLTSRRGELVGRENIINFVWPESPEEVNEWTLDQLIKRLRKKIKELKLEHKIITVKNQGYKIGKD